MRTKLLAATLLLATATAHAASPNYAIVDQIEAPQGAWSFATIDAAKRRLYVGRSEGILTVDLETKKATPYALDGKRVQLVVPIPGSDLVLGTKDKTDTAVLLDGGTGQVKGEVKVGRRPEMAAFDPSTGLVAVMAGSAEVTLVDPKTASAVGSIPVQGILEAGAADGKGKLFINLEDKDEIAVVDLAGKNLAGAYKLPGCHEPTGLGYDAKSGLLISVCNNKVAKLIDAASGADRGTIEVAGGPDAVLIDSERRLAFVPCSEGKLAIISLADAKQPKLLAQIPTAQGAKTGAVDPKTGRVYLPVGRAPATDFGGREVPGFAVLVVAPK